MSPTTQNIPGEFDAGPITAALREIVSARRVGRAFFINLPLVFPAGTAVTVKVEKAGNSYHVSDNGFAYRELEKLGSARSFANTSPETEDIQKDRRTLFVTADEEELGRAICDVAAASWWIVQKIYSDTEEEDQESLEEVLTGKLLSLFGEKHVELGQKIAGISSNDWDVSAVVRRDEEATAVFQAVSNFPNSVYRTSTAFRDISAIPRPPVLVAVVRSKKALGARLSLLSQSPAKIIEGDQSQEVFKRAATG